MPRFKRSKKSRHTHRRSKTQKKLKPRNSHTLRHPHSSTTSQSVAKRMQQPIGRGLTGSVQKINSMVVQKHTSTNTARIEEHAASILKEVDPDQEYTIYGTQFIPNTDGKVKIQLKYGGVSLNRFDDLLWSYTRAVKSENKQRQDEIRVDLQKWIAYIPQIKEGFERLYEFLPRIHSYGITHSDMGPGNLVWDGTRLRLIDWGNATFKNDPDFSREMMADMEGLMNIKYELFSHPILQTL